MSYKNIVFEHSEDGIALLTVSRPAKLNALNAETIRELDEAFAESNVGQPRPIQVHPQREVIELRAGIVFAAGHARR